jgi:hypothetical protein
MSSAFMLRSEFMCYALSWLNVLKHSVPESVAQEFAQASSFGQCSRRSAIYCGLLVRKPKAHDVRLRLPRHLTHESALHVILPSDVRTKIGRIAACLVLLIPLVLFEMYLCTAFLPMRWQRAIDHSLPDILPKSHDLTPITHPLLSEEIESVLREHVGLRITLFTVTVALLVGNAWLIRWVWRLSRAILNSESNS